MNEIILSTRKFGTIALIADLYAETAKLLTFSLGFTNNFNLGRFARLPDRVTSANDS